MGRIIQHFRERWNYWLYLLLSLAVTAGVFSYLFTHISWREVQDLLLHASLRGVLMMVALSMTMNVYRTWRYRLSLQVSGYVPSFGSLFLVTLIRGLCVDLLPARAGALVYVYLVTTRLGVPFGAAASSFALTFLFDTIALAPLLVIAAVWVSASVQLPAGIMIGGGIAIFVITGVIVYYLSPLLKLADWFFTKLSFLRERLRRRIRRAIAASDYQVRKARRSGVFFRLLFQSVIVRLTKYGTLYFFFYALTHPYGYKLSDLSVPRVFLGLVSAEMAASLPVSGIAGFGAYEGTWAWVFQILGFPGHVAKVTSVSHHLFTQLYGYGLGVAAILLLMLPVFKRVGGLKREVTKLSSPWLFYPASLALLVAAAGVLWMIYNVG